jgi:hypothetical protein
VRTHVVIAAAALAAGLCAGAATAHADVSNDPWPVQIDGTQKGGMTRHWSDGHGDSLPPIRQAQRDCLGDQWCLGKIAGKYPEWTIEKRILSKLGAS